MERRYVVKIPSRIKTKVLFTPRHGCALFVRSEGDERTWMESARLPKTSRNCLCQQVVGGGRDGTKASCEELLKISTPLIAVVDDDESIRESLANLLREFGFAAGAFASAEDFLGSDCLERTRCLILDVSMPGMKGQDLQRELTLLRREIPIVFITAQGDEMLRPRLLSQGAVGCLFKPFSATALLETLNAALK
jgi:CheY-like chemotaxis protein